MFDVLIISPPPHPNHNRLSYQGGHKRQEDFRPLNASNLVGIWTPIGNFKNISKDCNKMTSHL